MEMDNVFDRNQIDEVPEGRKKRNKKTLRKRVNNTYLQSKRCQPHEKFRCPAIVPFESEHKQCASWQARHGLLDHLFALSELSTSMDLLSSLIMDIQEQGSC